MARPTAAQIVAATSLAALLELKKGNATLTDCDPNCIDCTNSKGLVDCKECNTSRYCTRCTKVNNSTHSTDCRFANQCHHSTACIGLLADRSAYLYGCSNCESCDRIVLTDNLKGAKNVVLGVQLTAAQFTTIWDTLIVPELTAEQAAEDAAG